MVEMAVLTETPLLVEMAILGVVVGVQKEMNGTIR
jgi:hypothetical protein